MSEDSSKKRACIIIVAGMLALTIGVMVFRETLSRYSLVGYPALFVACFLLNSGVFGISPSGLVAIEASFLYDPLAVAAVAGVGAGLGEIGSYVTGYAGEEIVPMDISKKLEPLTRLPVFPCSFVTSFISGNLSDAYGLLVGARGGSVLPFISGVTLAKVIKMFLLVAAAHSGQAAFLLAR